MDDVIKMGSTVTDKITGFIGVVTGMAQYITGCEQVLVAPLVKEDGSYAESHWFDDQRLEVVGSKDPVSLDNRATPGPDRPAPKK